MEPNQDPRYEVRLLMAKARVSPVHGTTTPRAEMQSLVMLMRLILVAVSSLPSRIEKVIMALDSQCSIAATEKSGGLLGPYFANRVNEYHQLKSQVEALVGEVEPLQYIPGELNVSADMCTRGKADVKDMFSGGVWQEGPAFLKEERQMWPLSRHFKENSLPKEELRSRHEVLTYRTIQSPVSSQSSRLKELVEQNLEHHSDWEKSVRVLARVVRSMKACNPDMSVEERRALIKKDPGVMELEMARALQVQFSQEESIRALQQDRLVTLGGHIENGVVVVGGRVPGADLAKMLGKPCLPVIWANTRLARLIVRHFHKEDHRRTPSDIVARTRRVAWIPRCLPLAKSEVKSCMYCRIKKKQMEVQVMGSLPEGRIESTAPFLTTCLDLFGPISCRGLGGGVRKPMKAYGVIFGCLSTKAVRILATTGYSTKQFLVAYWKFVGNQGAPAVIVSDHGTQLVSAAKKQADPDATDINWDQVIGLASRSGTKWTFTEKGCPWRNGTAEAVVKLVKATLGHQLQSHVSLDWSELDSLFSQVANIINNRPLGVFHANEDFHQICPNDLLLGRTHRPSYEPDILDEPEVDVKKILTDREQLVHRWWKEWERKVFPTLLPRKKWHHQSRNVKAGDIVLIQYQGKVRTVWKLARVSGTFPDDRGVVRTCEVAFRGKDRGERLLPYKSKPQQKLRLAVQRLCVLLPMEEQGLEGKSTTSLMPEGKEVVEEGVGPCEHEKEGPQFNAPIPYQNERKIKCSKKERQDKTKVWREPRRFSKRLAGFSACLRVASNLSYYMSSEEDD